MKKSSASLLIAAVLILASCGTAAQYASSGKEQQFNDGIYSNSPAFRTKVEKEESMSETQALVEKTKESPIYLFGDKKDTIMIPENMSAVIKYDQKLGGTTVTVGENPYDWRYDLENNYGYWYEPYNIGSSWYWSRHYSPWYSWGYRPWRYDPWYYGGMYSHWYYNGWYDPWHYGWGWYDPWYSGWYGGYYGWYNPWHYGPHYAGWYGGWGPHWGGHHHGYHPGHHPGHDAPGMHRDIYRGQRHETTSERVFASGVSTRKGLGTSSRVSRNSSSGSSSVGRSQAVRSGSTATRVVSSNRATVSRAPSSGNRNTAVSSGSTSTTRRHNIQANHRKPASSPVRINNNTGTTRRATMSNGNSSVSTRQSSGYERSSSSYNRSSSSYNRSSSSSSRSSYSTGSSGSYSRGSSGGGGGYSRSGGSGGGRR